MTTAAKTQVTRVRNSSQNKSHKAIEAILRPLTAHCQGEWGRTVLAFVRDRVQSWQDPQVSLKDIEKAVQNWYRHDSFSAKLEAKWVGEVCQKLHEQPFVDVKEFLDEQLAALAQGKRDLRKLASMKKEIIAFFENLTDAEQLLLASTQFHCARSRMTQYWDWLHQTFDDAELLEEKAAALENDPRFAVLVRAFRLGRSAYAAYAPAL
jgi:DNA-binding transcriptional MerR regulator